MVTQNAGVTPGTLYVVATPIGHLGDLSSRALEVLGAVDLIAAEDTRHTRGLLTHFGIQKPLIPLHEHNEARQMQMLIARLQAGAAIALVSDAGTPLISDPGYGLVAAAAAAGVVISPIPGPCAAIAALSVSGLPTDRFVFEGFLPPRRPARRTRLQQLARERRTLIFYESPRRLVEVLADCVEVLGGERKACLGRELTKRFETVYRGTLADVQSVLTTHSDALRGECVLLVAGAVASATEDAAGNADAERILADLVAQLPASQVARLMDRWFGGGRAHWYQRAIALRAAVDL
ncbi:16S rRNA (cytidine(1402)-2'-O)-methyltransferase [Candidatus Macondimonas diazotrophica]|jgi:16S rRNA (cytidine1402-2'-O)-methyltransferase|uniref:Ribosomal RNA small subunit methyltransferase I n=1 Tax=Candidatus Macondimonas diazotrophica TaxID=2305248 RepID=A0A4Z0FA59_9GAMM|nr:16S rRNA (cytidine(1402)-2'-O)-methyltransferase [Candidatus Macondimonas diazotrophica]NCU00227.1 16S rRNA (cytidine(1402)-2'-O)-methyltransferase [Candidatus Macondimonas diazotrophica]TFZ83020.1 16S rRNA (cytidine(1402)-2'-O)-methyltransferase [Candidatus Macondimonas diazotrophica]HBG51269.1 16S rRNA (cytidine(1402)-2'-O)-methyltransferase [Gammaproteobacteria bacterium]